MRIRDASFKCLLAIAVLALTATATQAATVIETVAVGNPGNADDTHGDGYGGVAYVYNIGKYEVTAGQYAEFLNAVAATDTYGLYDSAMWTSEYGCKIQRSGALGSYSYSVAADQANRPVNFVSFWDAARFANWLHNGQQGAGTTEYGAYHDIGSQFLFGRNQGAQFFIPTEDEWYKAAYHKNDGVTGNYFDYATSGDTPPSNDLVDPDPGNNATFYDYGYTIGSPYWRTEVGAHENSESPYGTFDQCGNVVEWNETAIDSDRGLRGGQFYADGWLSASERGNLNPTLTYSTVGFRVASIPEPGSLALLVGGLVAAVIWRRHRRQQR